MNRRTIGAMIALAGLVLVIVAVVVIRPDDDLAPAATSSTTATTQTTSSTTSTTVAAETAEQFLDELFAALVATDVDTLFDRLHPVVIDQFGAEACRSYLSTLDDPTAAFTLISVGEPEVFAFDSGNEVIDVPDAVSVRIDRVARGETVEQTLHLARVDQRLRWFTLCPT